MRVDELLWGTGVRLISGDGSTVITDLSEDSRCITQGGAFIARSGTKVDGRSYIQDAIRRGAAAVISDSAPPIADRHTVAWAVTDHVDQHLIAHLGQRFFDWPIRKLKLVGITGTNGKTTTAFLIQHLLAVAGTRCGMLSTVFNDDGRDREPAELTTPGPIDLARWFARMVANGCRVVVLEVSSHALDQQRTALLGFDVAVFTNLTGDHLDYHVSMDRYAAAKAKLFEGLDAGACVVLNSDDPYAGRMGQTPAAVSHCRLNTPIDDQTDCAAIPLALEMGRSRVRLDGPWGSVTVRLPLVGQHNVLNALLATAAASAITDVSRTIASGLESCPCVPGRLEVILPEGTDGQPTVLVDYAHTHDALENVLGAIRPLTDGRVIVVFGCGGDRDRTKRAKMAAVACRLADRIVITSDNPRTEDPLAIIRGILEGVPEDRLGYVIDLPDRRSAIFSAIDMASSEDIVLIAGKGHEDYQIVGTTKHPFDDRRVAADALWARSQCCHDLSVRT